MNKKIVCLTLCTIFVSTFFAQADLIQSTSRLNQEPEIDWWPMQFHDLQNTGFSTSEAPNTNHTLWMNTTDDALFSSPAVVEGRVYIGSWDYHIYCFDAETGERLWVFETGFTVSSSPAVNDGKVYCGSNDGTIYCLDAKYGNCIWSYWTGAFLINSAPKVYAGRVYIGTIQFPSSGILYCLDAETGSPIWEYQTGGSLESTPAIAENRVFIGSYDGFLHCVDAVTGNLIWTFDASDHSPYPPDVVDSIFITHERQIGSSPSIYQDKVIFSTTDGTVFCLKTCSGEQAWRYQAGLGRGRSSPVVVYGRVYVGSYIFDWTPPYNYYGQLYCLDVGTGRQIWNYTIYPDINFPYWFEAFVNYCSVADGKVYFGVTSFDLLMLNDYIYCLDAISGDFIWRFITNGDVLSVPAIANEKLYVGSDNGLLYCFGGT